MNYDIIATGSTGNATVIEDSILIDCGVPFKAISPYLDRLRLVLLTHTHSDHFRIATVRAMARRRPALRWACCEWMVNALIWAGVNKYVIDVIEPGCAASYDGLAAVMPEEIPHNVQNCCWHVFIGDESLFYATDTGTLDGITAEDYDLYMVEANHTRAEIAERIAEKEARGEYAYELRAAENHLSMEQAIDWFAANAGPHSLWIPMHGHIDRGGDQHGRSPDASEDHNRE